LGEGFPLPPFYLDKHKRLLKLLREFRDNEEGYGVVLAEFESFLNLEEERLRYRAMAFDVMRTAALENPRDLRYEPYIRKLVERLLSYDDIKDKLVADFEFLFGEYFYLEHIYSISLIFWRALERLGAKGSMERIRKEILSSNVGEWIKRAEDLGILP
jgi:hypothetical protein